MARCKVICAGKNEDVREKDTIDLRFEIVTEGSSENESFFKVKPNGMFRIFGVDKEAGEEFTEGKEYFIDISESKDYSVCKLMSELMDIEGVCDLPYKSIERIKRIICGTHNGVCIPRFSGEKERSN